MCVAVKRKLQLYYWKNNEFNSFDEDINLTDIPKALSWCQETICVGYKGEYSLYEVSITNIKNLSNLLFKMISAK